MAAGLEARKPKENEKSKRNPCASPDVNGYFWVARPNFRAASTVGRRTGDL